ncbi:MAG TPA: glucosaminidase, partial [Macellibacteroides fermentans]|nr:glucosaminidase [Macellibacteroides fermentans]
FDFCRLIRSSYTVAANVSNVPAAYAQEIAYSRYISEVNGDNRQNYKRMLIRISTDMERLIALQFPE